jgi:hypothetical protein
MLLLIAALLSSVVSTTPTPPDFPHSFALNFTATVFELDQIGNGTLFYSFQDSPTPDQPSWQTVRNSLCPTGDTSAPCDYVFLDYGSKQQFWVVQPHFCCMALPVGPVVPDVLRNWSFFGTFGVEGTVSDNFYSLLGGVNNLNTFSVAHQNKTVPIAMTRAGEGAFNSTLLWKFAPDGFVVGPQSDALWALPPFCKPSCGSEHQGAERMVPFIA